MQSRKDFGQPLLLSQTIIMELDGKWSNSDMNQCLYTHIYVLIYVYMVALISVTGKYSCVEEEQESVIHKL